jgi:hypothetical protein
MATMRGLRPARVLAARGVLSGQPPATDLGRVRRLLEVQDEHDVADEAFERRRQVGEPAVEVKPVGAGAHSLPARELVRPRWIAHVIHAEAGREVRRDRALVGGVSSWFTSITPACTRTLCEWVPGDMPSVATTRGRLGSRTSTIEVPSGLRMWPM